ncbi:MAG: selenoneine synthase SenA [Pirellulaceae bacterium]
MAIVPNTTVDMVSSDRATSAEVLASWVRDAREYSVRLIDDLDDQQLIGPQLPTINPLVWEIGHAAWFQERWVLQHTAGQPPISRESEDLFDSIAIEHDVRWDLPLPRREVMFGYARQVCDNVLELLEKTPLTDDLIYFIKLSVFHEDMHAESFLYTRQTLGYPAPNVDSGSSVSETHTLDIDTSGDIEYPGGQFLLGADRDAVFAFDNEKWAHPVTVDPFAMSRQPVTMHQFANFVDDNAYSRRDLWSEKGWEWRQSVAAQHPAYWKREGDRWLFRHFNQWLPLHDHHAMIHVNWYEADAFCRWSGRRLPSEAEWEFAAAGNSPSGKRHYPWGDAPPVAASANFDWQLMGAGDTRRFAAGDTPEGCRQLLGNVWEWTSCTFGPYPDFVADPYKEYSRSCFGIRNALRGGCWATRGRMMRNTWRNYYQPDRRDVFAGFRTCALPS